MRKWFEKLRANPMLARGLVIVLCMLGVGATAYCWGRHNGRAQAPIEIGTNGPDATPASHATTDYQRRVVATIYDNIPITREELGEFLIARVGADRLDFLVNKKIVELALKSKGLKITDAEVEAQLKEDMKVFGGGVSEEIFANKILKNYGKTLYEYKEDVIRPKLAMVALVKSQIVVMPEDIQREFDAKYGQRVHCRMIAVLKDFPRAKLTELWDRLRKGEADFLDEAGKQAVPDLASHKGDIPPIHKNFPNPMMEKEAFSLQPGDISSIITVEDGTSIILRCEKHIPADSMVRLEDVRGKLIQEIETRKLMTGIPRLLDQMQREARPSFVLPQYLERMRPAARVDTKPMVPAPVAQ